MDSNRVIPYYWGKHSEEDNVKKGESTLPAIPQPETPKEPMEFLSRSWSLSSNEISKALARKHKQPAFDTNPSPIPETLMAPQLPEKIMKPINARIRGGPMAKFFNHKESNSRSTEKQKDKARMENAHIHAALSVAGLATALAAATSATENSKMSTAMASATELLASYCIELAESAGAEHEAVASVVRSAVGVRTASDILTLTAAAATALRGEAALKTRLRKEAKRSATINPYEKGVVDTHFSPALFQSEIEEEKEEDELPCVGDLLQLTQKGVLRWKHVSVYINKKHQVTIELKSKHVGGAFSKRNKCTVYEVIDESGGWPFEKERENIEVYFGVKTAQGLMEFKCKNKVHRKKWVEGIKNLLQHRSYIEEPQNSLRLLNIN